MERLSDYHFNQVIKLSIVNRKVHVYMLSRFSHVWVFATLCDVVHQAPLPMEFFRQEYWSGVAMPSSRESSQPRDWTRISCIAGRFFTTEPLGKP